MTRLVTTLLLAGVLTAGAVPAPGILPLYFTATGPTIFAASSPESRVQVTPAGVTLTLRNHATVQTTFAGANPQAEITGAGELAGKVNILKGQDAVHWQTGLPTFARVQVANLYPGINTIYYGNGTHLEYDFQVAAGANPACIQFQITGASQVGVTPAGELSLTVGTNELRQARPVIYQEIAGVRRAIAGGYQLRGDHTVGFQVGDYDSHQPLVIDPILNYSSYLGGSGYDSAVAVAVNNTDGSVFVAGETVSANLATNAFQRTSRGGAGGDAYVAKFDKNFNLQYLTYLGGSGSDGANALAVDSAGRVFVGGFTDSTDFPVTNSVPGLVNHLSGVPQPGATYPLDGFVTELAANGASLIFSTYFGGSGEDNILSLALDSADNIYFTGYTLSTNLPVKFAVPFRLSGTNAPYLNYLACPYTYYTCNAFIAKIATGGTNLDYCSYFGGNNFDQATGIGVDSANNVYLAGYTASTTFPNTNALLIGTNLNNSTNYTVALDGFVAKFAPTATNLHLLYSCYLGNTNTDAVTGLAVDNTGVYVTGFTTSSNFYKTVSTTLIATGVTNNPSGISVTTNAFLTKIVTTNGNLPSIGYSVVFGGLVQDVGSAVAVDTQGNAFVTGSAQSPTFPGTNSLGLLRTNQLGGFDVFVTAFNASCTQVYYSVLLGGSGDDAGYAIAVDQNSAAYVVGQTDSGNFPVTTNAANFPIIKALSPNFSGNWDGFLAKIQLNFSAGLTLTPVAKTNQVTLSWLYNTNIAPEMAQCVLQASTNFSRTNWANITNGWVNTSNINTLIWTESNRYEFFRLHNTNIPY